MDAQSDLRSFEPACDRIGHELLKRIRRVGCAFVHRSDRPSARALRPLRTAFRFGFDLLALRARRNRQSTSPKWTVQGDAGAKIAQFAELQLSTFPQPFLQSVDKH